MDVMSWQVKAAGPQSFIDLLKVDLGAERFDQVVKTLPERVQHVVSRRLLAVEWISYDDILPLNDWILGELGSEEKYIEMLRRVARRDFTGVYRFLLRVMSPLYVLEQAGRIMTTYNTRGRVALTRREEHDGRRHFTLQLSEIYPRPVLVLNIQGYVIELLHLTGARDIKVERRGLITNSNGLSCEIVGSFVS